MQTLSRLQKKTQTCSSGSRATWNDDTWAVHSCSQEIWASSGLFRSLSADIRSHHDWLVAQIWQTSVDHPSATVPLGLWAATHDLISESYSVIIKQSSMHLNATCWTSYASLKSLFSWASQVTRCVESSPYLKGHYVCSERKLKLWI